MLRTVGFYSILISVLCLRQGWYVVYQHVRKVHPFTLRGIWGMAVFGLFGFFLVLCALLGYWVGPFTSCGVQGLGIVGVPFSGYVLWTIAVLGITCMTSGEIIGQLIIQSVYFGVWFVLYWSCIC